MLPTRQRALELLNEAHNRNPGPWFQHSIVTAEAAQAVAARHASLDPGKAYILGCLHDIGRREGVTGIRHVLDGYHFLVEQGFEEAARISMTHSYPVQDVRAGSDKWDGSGEELQVVKDYLAGIEYDDYDRLIQLCDSLAFPSGCCLLEKRIVNVVLRYGTNEFTIAKWKATFSIKEDFETAIGTSIYQFLPGVVENTFGFDPQGPES